MTTTPQAEGKALHTPLPWKIGEYSEHLGYDCMTGGIRVGPVVLDGADYGQKSCAPISAESLARMEADAALIANGCNGYAVLRRVLKDIADLDTETTGNLHFAKRIASEALSQTGGKG